MRRCGAFRGGGGCRLLVHSFWLVERLRSRNTRAGARQATQPACVCVLVYPAVEVWCGVDRPPRDPGTEGCSCLWCVLWGTSSAEPPVQPTTASSPALAPTVSGPYHWHHPPPRKRTEISLASGTNPASLHCADCPRGMTDGIAGACPAEGSRRHAPRIHRHCHDMICSLCICIWHRPRWHHISRHLPSPPKTKVYAASAYLLLVCDNQSTAGPSP